ASGTSPTPTATAFGELASADPAIAATDQVLSSYGAGDAGSVAIAPLTPDATDPSSAITGPPTAPDGSLVDAVITPPTEDNSNPHAATTVSSSTTDNSASGASGLVSTLVPQSVDDSTTPTDAQARKLLSILAGLG